MKKLKDYSGPIKDNLKLEDFSKEFLVKLAKEWQAVALKLEELWYKDLEERLGKGEADEWEKLFWAKQAKITLPRMAKLANIQVKDVVDAFKLGQLMIEGPMGFQPLSTYEIVNGNRNHVIWTAKRCLNLEYFEKADPGRIIHMCHDVEGFEIDKYFHVFFPDVKVTPLKLPPRKSRDETPCRWEVKRKAEA